MSERIDQLESRLKEQGVTDPYLLVVLNLGNNEQVIGEIEEFATLTPNVPVKIFNPKRLLRIQQVANGGLTIHFYVGDMDLVTGGEVHIAAPLVYRLTWLDEESRAALLQLYIEYTDRRAVNRAAAAGVITPATGLIRAT